MTDTYIFDEFSKLNLPKIDRRKISDMEKLVRKFEIRGYHALAFNTQMLGIDQANFLKSDKDSFFSLFDMDEEYLKKIIKSIPSINNEFKVRSDTFNIFSIWMVHKAFKDIASRKTREKFQINIIKYLHYKFFTSFVNHCFPYGAKESIMRSTVNRLTKKYDITIHGTWKNVMEKRSEDVISKSSIHLKTLETAKSDESFLYVISDIQTRIRDRIKKIVRVYHDTKKQGLEIRSRPAVMETDDDIILMDRTSVLNIMMNNTMHELFNPRVFVDPDSVRKISTQFTGVTTQTLDQTLVKISQLAIVQARTRELDISMQKSRKGTIIGVRALIKDIIKAMYSYARKKRLSFKNKAQVYVKTKNMISSSRTMDKNILDIKARTELLIDQMVDTTRESTKIALKIAFITYVIYKSLKYG